MQICNPVGLWRILQNALLTTSLFAFTATYITRIAAIKRFSMYSMNQYSSKGSLKIIANSLIKSSTEA
ncbi:MAG TPA: hypothetical protein VKM55_26465 [Candidatus Lokiarchaeia archaeon]|nr:hypothetical protein [Candidatus Lokiarchaeia archaeon]